MRYVGDPALNEIRIRAHCLDEAKPPPEDVTIVHAGREGGEARTRKVTVRGPSEYDVECAGDPEDDFIPTPGQDGFLDYWQRVLPEYRYGVSSWNPYVYRQGRQNPLEGFQERLSTQRSCANSMTAVAIRYPRGSSAAT